MPVIHYRGSEIECERGDVLRDALIEAGETPHNGRSRLLNCRGHATCGTCAVAVEGEVSDPGDRERRRLSAPPHDADAGLRLACQTRVLGDVTVAKHPGFWGQHADEPEIPTDGDDVPG